MSDKQCDKQSDKTKNKLTNSNPDIAVLIERKITFFQDTFQRTILHVQNNKMLNIINVSEMNNCINILFDLSKILNEITSISNEILTNTDSVINKLQNINNELSTLFKMIGTELFEDFLWICFGNN